MLCKRPWRRGCEGPYSVLWFSVPVVLLYCNLLSWRPCATNSVVLSRQEDLAPSSPKVYTAGRTGGYSGRSWSMTPQNTNSRISGAPGATRTPDARFRKPTLYPLSYGGW